MNPPSVLGRWLKSLPDFEATLTALVRLPHAGESEFVANLVDQDHEITYSISSARSLEPSEMRQALIRAFAKIGDENKSSFTYRFELDDLESN